MVNDGIRLLFLIGIKGNGTNTCIHASSFEVFLAETS